MYSSTGYQTVSPSSCDEDCDSSCDFLGFSCDHCDVCSSCPIPTRIYPYGETFGFGCKFCQPGRYTPYKKQKRCNDCPAGRYSSVPSRKALVDCNYCPDGKIGTRTGLDKAESCETCVAGQYSKAGDTKCTVCEGCEVGWYRSECGGGNPGKCVRCSNKKDNYYYTSSGGLNNACSSNM